MHYFLRCALPLVVHRSSTAIVRTDTTACRFRHRFLDDLICLSDTVLLVRDSYPYSFVQHLGDPFTSFDLRLAAASPFISSISDLYPVWILLNAHFLGLIANWLKEKAPNLAAWRFLKEYKIKKTKPHSSGQIYDLSFFS